LKNIVLSGVMVICMLGVHAQQKPHYTQYIINQYIINPALSGIENYTDLKISHRHQWVGIQDAPVTTYLTIQGPFRKSDLRTSPTGFQPVGDNTWGSTYWDQYSAPEPHHGVGLQVINDVTGPLNKFSAFATYAYHIALTNKMSLSLGFGAGITNTSLKANKLHFAVEVDPSVYGSDEFNKIRPDVNAGVYLYSSKFFAGISALQVLPQKIKFNEGAVTTEDGKQVPHLFITGGYRIGAGSDFNLIPSVMLKYVSPTPLQVDINAKLQYKDLLWIGAGVRPKDGFNGMVGMNVGNTFNVSYSYDYNTSEIHNYSKGTHEIIIGFLLGNRFGDTCPRRLW
jgi:type IX secretion system PorP/SprF family membrane protein